MKKAPLALLAVALVAWWPATAAADWFSFGKKDERPTSTRPMFDGKPLHANYPADRDSGPSIWTKMNNGTRAVFSGTRETFTGSRPEAKAASAHRLPWQQQPAPKKKQGWFSSWFSEPVPAKPETPQEWISQKRPSMF